jgi:hypothetical protein
LYAAHVYVFLTTYCFTILIAIRTASVIALMM